MMHGFLERLHSPAYIARMGPKAYADGHDYVFSTVFDVTEGIAIVKGGIHAEDMEGNPTDAKASPLFARTLVRLIFAELPTVHAVIWFHKGKPTAFSRQHRAVIAA